MSFLSGGGTPERMPDYMPGQSPQEQEARRYSNAMLAEQKRQTMDLLQLEPGMSVIEIGCGLGLDAEALAARVGPTGRVVGIDASQGGTAQLASAP